MILKVIDGGLSEAQVFLAFLSRVGIVDNSHLSASKTDLCYMLPPHPSFCHLTIFYDHDKVNQSQTIIADNPSVAPLPVA